MKSYARVMKRALSAKVSSFVRPLACHARP